MSSPKTFDVDAIILDLSEINNVLRTVSPSEKQRFLRNFDEWVTQRRNTLSDLKRLETELNDVCFKANIGKCVGTGASIVGGLAALIGLGLQLSSNQDVRSAGKKLAGVGTGAGVVGGATSASSSVVEYVVNRKLLDEVRSSLMNDQVLTRQLVPYLKRSSGLNTLFERVFGCNIFSDTANDIFTVIQGMTFLYQEGKYAYNQISKALSYGVNDCSRSCELQNLQRVFKRLNKKAQFVLREFCENRKVREALLKMDQAMTPITWDITKVSARVLFRMAVIANETGYLSLVMQFAGSAAKATDILLRTLSLAQDIVRFISAAKDIKDSQSKYCGMVQEMELFLLKELNEANVLVNKFKRGEF